jgi:hypothetical protein
MARTKRKLKTRARAHVKHVRAERKKRIHAAGGQRTANTRSKRRMRRLAAKVARS